MSLLTQFLFPCYRYSLIICRHPSTLKFLTVEQTSGKWWIPGGKVENTQTFQQAAYRQCLQQTGIQIKLKGIIRVDYGKFFQKNAWRTVYYAEPTEGETSGKLKTVEDGESRRAEWMTLKEIQAIKQKWRGREIYDFPNYIDQGGQYYPLAVFKEGFKHDEKMI